MTAVFIDKEHPEVFRAMVEVAGRVTAAAEAAGLDRGLVELLNVRVSQLTGCAYCLDLHARRALRAGESAQRLAVLPAWRETDLFDARERAALTLVESVTELPGAVAQEADEAAVRAVLGAAEFSAVAWVAVAMNAFNRISIVSHHPVRPRRSEPAAR